MPELHNSADPDCMCEDCSEEHRAYIAHCKERPDPDPCHEDYPGQYITGSEGN